MGVVHIQKQIITGMGEIMGQVIVTHKTHSRYLLAVLFIILLYNACEPSYPPIKYELLNLKGKKQVTVNRDIDSYEELINRGSIFYFEFANFGNRNYSQIAISLYTLDEHQTIKIHNLEFEFENKVKIVKVNNTIELNKASVNQNPRLFIVEENAELAVETFFSYIFFHLNSIKINLQRVFNKKDKDIGKTIDLTLRINYSFDGGEVRMQEIKYIIDILRGWFVQETYV
jgi:hypothetical protein